MKRWKVYLCAAVFLLLTAVKMIAPAAAADARKVLLPAINADDDYKSVFAEIRSVFAPAPVQTQDEQLRQYLPAVNMSVWSTPAPEPTPTPTPEPTPEPTPTPTPQPKTATFKLGVANCQSYDGTKTEDAWRGRAAIFAREGWQVVCCTETSNAGRAVMLDELKRLTKHTWTAEVFDAETVCVLYDTTVFTAGRKTRTADFHTAFGHGAIVVPLVVGGLGVDVAAVHVRPGSVASDAGKLSDMAKAAGLAGTWPFILGGDFNWNRPAIKGLVRVGAGLDTHDAAKLKALDNVFVRSGTEVTVTATDERLVNPGSLSDHRWLGYTVHLLKPVTT